MDLDSAGFVFLGDEDWDEVWRRSQYLVAGLARRLPRARFLFVERPVDLPHRLRTGRIFRSAADLTDLTRRARAATPVDGFPNVFRMRALEIAPVSLPGGRVVSELLQARAIEREIKRLLPAGPIGWVQNPGLIGVVEHLSLGALVYDLTDDWPAAETISAAEQWRLTRSHRDLLQRADWVVACSPHLFERSVSAGPRLHLLRNGVDAARFATATMRVPEGRDRPLIGYVGTLHPERLDPDILEAVTLANPGALLVLVGPDHLGPALRRRLAANSSIEVRAPVSHDRVPALLREFSVCVVPHRDSDFTASLDPLKLLEYLAARRPVVTSDFPAARELTAYVDIATTPAEFASSVAARLARTDDARLDAGVRYAGSRSWDAVVGEALELLSIPPLPAAALPRVSLVVPQNFSRSIVGEAASRTDVSIEVLRMGSDWGLRGLRKRLNHVRWGWRTAWAGRETDDLVLCSFGSSDLAVVGLLARLAKAGAGLFALDMLIPPPRPRSWVEAAGLPRIREFICIRSGDMAVLARRFGVDPRLVRFLPLGIEAPLTRRPTADAGFVYSAGWAGRDWACLLDALAKSRWEARLSMDPARMAAVRPGVRLLPQLAPAEGREEMASASVVVLPMHDADQSAGPLVLLDAMGLGKPIIASDSNGTRDYVEDGVTGFLVSPRDSEAMARRIDQLMSDPALRRQMGDMARSRALGPLSEKAFIDGLVALISEAGLPPADEST